MSELADATNEQLLLRIETGENSQKRSAWNELLKRDKEKPLHNLCLCDVIARAESPYRNMAWGILWERKVEGIDLCYIIKRTKAPSNAYQERAWALLLEMRHDDGYCFYYLIEYASHLYKERAVEQYCKRGFPLEELKSSLEHKHKTVFWKEKIEPLFIKKPG